MKLQKFFAVALILLSLAEVTSCTEKEDYETGSGTASRSETEESKGLVNEGEINDASEWGPVVGIQ